MRILACFFILSSIVACIDNSGGKPPAGQVIETIDVDVGNPCFLLENHNEDFGGYFVLSNDDDVDALQNILPRKNP